MRARSMRRMWGLRRGSNTSPAVAGELPLGWVEIGLRFVFVDESGDLAVRRLGTGTGASDFFVIVPLMMDDPVPVYSAIDELKDRLGMPRREEFRFSATSPIRRRAFLEELRRHEMAIRASVVNKAQIAERPEAANERLLYRDLIQRTLVQHQEDLGETVLVLDEYIRGRQAQRQFNTSLRQAVNTHDHQRLITIRHERSQTNNLIQAADMAAGAVYRSHAHGDGSYLRIIRSRVRTIQNWAGAE